MVDDEEREVFDLILEQLGDYRALCEKAGCDDKVAALSRLEDNVRILEEKLAVDYIKILDNEGTVLSIPRIEEIVIKHTRPRFKSKTDMARVLNIGRSTLYRRFREIEKSTNPLFSR